MLRVAIDFLIFKHIYLYMFTHLWLDALQETMAEQIFCRHSGFLALSLYTDILMGTISNRGPIPLTAHVI